MDKTSCGAKIGLGRTIIEWQGQLLMEWVILNKINSSSTNFFGTNLQTVLCQFLISEYQPDEVWNYRNMNEGVNFHFPNKKWPTHT